MANKIFKLVAASFTLLLYLSTMVASDVVALTCHCLVYHQDGCQIAHSHSSGKIYHHHHTACGEHSECGDCTDCDSHDEYNRDFCKISLQGSNCGCDHNHSTEVELYTQPRIGDDDELLRYAMAVVAVTNMDPSAGRCELQVNSFSYGVYLLPPLSAAYLSSSSLRAPPVLV